MSGWDGIGKAIDAGDTEETARLVSALDEPGRREIAKALPAKLKAMRAASEFGFLNQGKQEALLLTGAGTIGGPAAAAAWLCRRDLRIWWRADRFADLAEGLRAVTGARPDELRAEVAHRIAARMRVTDGTWFPWHVAATLTKSAGAAPPDSDAFVVGWVGDGVRPRELASDPFLDALVPRLFEADGVGARLADEAARHQWDDDYRETLAGSLAGLARAGRLERTGLLDGCVSRFLRGGTARDLRWFVRLHTALEPTEDEAAARVRDYARLLPAAPSTVADLALHQVRRADDLGRLDPELFDEAAGAVLFRPEKKLVRATLTWLDRTARKRDRVDATLRAVATVFASGDFGLQERAVKIAAKHASLASEPVRTQIRDAAAELPADLRAVAAEAFGEAAASVETGPPMGPPPFVPRDLPAPIGSLAELTDEFTTLVRSIEDWRTTERFLAALIEFAYEDDDAAREALRRRVSSVAPWIVDPRNETYMRPHIRESWIQFPVQSLIYPRGSQNRFNGLKSLFGVLSRDRGTQLDPQIERFLTWRRHEIASAVGKVPVLLATPTEGSGHIAPDVLVRRLERLEEAGAEPGGADLVQAMLRIPREIDPSAVARAKGLTSNAGQAVASWFVQGGLADPEVECAILDDPIGTVQGRKVRLPARVLSTVDVPGDSGIADLCRFPEDGWRDFGTPYIYRSFGFWPPVLPSHREVTAAHLVPYLAGTDDDDRGQGGIMLDLAEADGPAGAATGTLLAYALANRHRDERADAGEAFLAFSARGGLPAAETGTALGRLAGLGRITLSRAVKALTTAADAGAHAEVWATVAAALPHALPGRDEPAKPGVSALLALAAGLAESTGAKGAIPAVAEVASRGGSSRLVKEAARLHRFLAT